MNCGPIEVCNVGNQQYMTVAEQCQNVFCVTIRTFQSPGKERCTRLSRQNCILHFHDSQCHGKISKDFQISFAEPFSTDVSCGLSTTSCMVITKRHKHFLTAKIQVFEAQKKTIQETVIKKNLNHDTNTCGMTHFWFRNTVDNKNTYSRSGRLNLSRGAATSAKFGSHAGNTKFNTQNE